MQPNRIKMQALGRKPLLFLTLAGVVGLAIFAPAANELKTMPQAANVRGASPTPALATSPAPPLAGKAAGAAVAPSLPSTLPARSAMGEAQADLFAAQSWQPPAPKAAPPAPPPAPQAPAMAYRFAGRLVQDGVAKIFVTKGDTPVAVKVGDALDGYVVESIGAQSIGLVYPPLGTKASIAISAAPDAPVPSDASAQRGSAVSSQRSSPVLPMTGATSASAANVPAAQAGAAVLLAPSGVAGKAARVQWDGPAQVKAGVNFSLSLRAQADQAISASPMQLRFDPAVLESVAVRPGRLYASEAGRGFTYRVNPEGAIFIGASRQSVAGAGAGSEGAELVVLVFKPLRSGAFAEVSLTALNLQGVAGRALAHEALAAFRVPVTP